MRKFSFSFLVGFAIVSSVGAAAAQGVDAGVLSNSLSSEVLSMDGLRANAKLGGAQASNPFSEAAASLTAPADEGLRIDIPTVQAKIGSGTDFSLPANALTGFSTDGSANMLNALEGPAPTGGADSLQAHVVLGAATSDLSNEIGAQIRSERRLGN